MACHECSGNHPTSYHNLSTQVRTKVTVEESGPATQVMPWTGLPQFRDAELPEDLEFIGGSTEEGKSWRVPVQRILPGGELNNIQYSVPKKTADITIPRGQVVPVYIPNALEPIEEAQAVEGKMAQAIAVAEDPNKEGYLVLQQTGFLTFPRTHAYTTGKTYYLSPAEAGKVVSVKPSGPEVQPLFTVINELTLAINVQAV